MQWMHTFNSALSPIHMQATILEIDLSPSQGAKLTCSQSMSVSQQDSRCIPSAIPSPSTGSLDQPIHFLLG
jgi:hypothetical protein